MRRPGIGRRGGLGWTDGSRRGGRAEGASDDAMRRRGPVRGTQRVGQVAQGGPRAAARAECGGLLSVVSVPRANRAAAREARRAAPQIDLRDAYVVDCGRAPTPGSVRACLPVLACVNRAVPPSRPMTSRGQSARGLGGRDGPAVLHMARCEVSTRLRHARVGVDRTARLSEM